MNGSFLKRKRLLLWEACVSTILVSMLLSASLSVVSAEEGETLINPSEVMRLVNEQYIANSVQVMKDMGETEVAILWEGAHSGSPLLQWGYNPATDTIVVLNWVVPVYNGDAVVGLIGIDPNTGAYSWRIDDLPAQYRFPSIPREDKLRAVVKGNADSTQWHLYDIGQVKLTLIGYANYWVIPTFDGKIDSFIVMPVDEPYQATFLVNVKSEHVAYSERSNGGSLYRLESHKVPENLLQALANVSNKGVTTQSTSDTWMKDYVPHYRQGTTNWCGIYSLAMVHQWWSPVRLGTGPTQAREIADYLGKNANQGITVQDAVAVMKNWHAINSMYESWPNSDWVTMYGITKGYPSGDMHDLKTWINFSRVPVITPISHLPGGWHTDHAVVVVGYNDDDFSGVGGVYVDDPAHWLGWPSDQPGVSYDDFNDRYWVFCADVVSDNVGIIGYPGDLNGVDSSISLKGVPSSIYDDQEAQVTVEMKVEWDGTASSPSSFNEWCMSGIHVRTASSDGTSGNGTLETSSTGSFDEWTGYTGRNAEIVCSSATSSICEAKIFEFYTENNARDSTLNATFKVKPTDIGNMHIYYRSWVFDEDDRMHYSDPDLTITVYDDRDHDDGDLSMPKPVIYLRGNPDTWMWNKNYLDYLSHSTTITVQDDDDSGPTYSNVKSIPSSPVYDDHNGYIRLQGDVSDPSDIYSVRFGYGYGGVIDYWVLPSGQSGDTYRYDIPRTEWIEHIGDRISWRIKAKDNDNDRPNDRKERLSDWQYVNLYDDDTSGPTITDHWDSGDAPPGTYYFKVKLSDPSGILDDTQYPRIYYRWDNNQIDDSL